MPGQKDTYTLQNSWAAAPYSGKWITYTTSDESTHYVHANETEPHQASLAARVASILDLALRRIRENHCGIHSVISSSFATVLAFVRFECGKTRLRS